MTWLHLSWSLVPVLAIVRLFVILAVLGVIVVGSMLALSELVEPEQREVTVTVAPGRFNR